MYMLKTKINLHQYIIHIKQQNFNTADIRWFTVFLYNSTGIRNQKSCYVIYMYHRTSGDYMYL